MTSALEGVWGQRHAPATLTPRKDPVPIVQEAGWASGLIWTGAENLTPTGIRSPDRPARRQSLYILHYPAHSFPCRVNICSEQNCYYSKLLHVDVLQVFTVLQSSLPDQ